MSSSHRFRLDDDSQPDWRPLERLAELCSERPGLPPLDPDAFMYMSRLVHPRRRPVMLYKHGWTLRYQNLDDAGHAYRTRLVGHPSIDEHG